MSSFVGEFKKIQGTTGDDSLFGGTENELINSEGGNDLISGGGGIDIISGGAGIDTITFAAYTSGAQISCMGASSFVYSGTGFEGSFDDIENIVGSQFNDVVVASNFDNVIQGGGGNDELYGLAGNDILVGGEGNDSLVGGVGADRFVLNRFSVDQITDFSSAEGDKIVISPQGLRGNLREGSLSSSQFVRGTRARDFNDRLIYNQSSGALFYDADGAGFIKQVQIGTFANKPALGAADIIIAASPF